MRSPYVAKEYFFDGEGGSLPMITEELFQVIEMKVRDATQGSAYVT